MKLWKVYIKYNQKLCRVIWFLAIETPLFSEIMHIRYHSKKLRERNLILAKVVKSCQEQQGQILQYNSISRFGLHLNSKRLANADKRNSLKQKLKINEAAKLP